MKVLVINSGSSSLKYQLIGAEGSGALSIGSENVFAVSGSANGSMATVNKGYKFIGWFLDEACSRPVPAEWVDAETLMIVPQNDGVWTSNSVYYAKIDPDVSSLTIVTQGVSAADEGQVFIYRIKGRSSNVKDIDFIVTVTGDGTAVISDLAIGEYTVIELTDWSFRYTVVNAEKDISLAVDGQKNVVTFGHIRSENRWLDGNDSTINVFE